VAASRCRHFCDTRLACAAAAGVWRLTRLAGMNPDGEIAL
jgi:hypothetical protein